MVSLLGLRKSALEGQIVGLLREARAAGTKANVKALSAALRDVKRQLAAARGQGKGGLADE